MFYVNRRIGLEVSGSSQEVDDTEFINSSKITILLGEPGSGKSDSAKYASELFDCELRHARQVYNGSPLNLSKNDKIVIIDGLDELNSRNPSDLFNRIIERLYQENFERFLITCRSADWNNTSYLKIIKDWFDLDPAVGILKPLNDGEITQIVKNSNIYSESDDFLESAKKKGYLDLARNPQLLKMLLSTVKKSGWPESKTELYELTCGELAQESNEAHQVLNPERASLNEILSCTGYVCTLLLLNGLSGINIDGLENEEFPRPREFVSTLFDAEQINQVISTKIFAAFSANKLQPIHRTISEYLAARWLRDYIKNLLSRRRIDGLIYPQNTVPSSLRGLNGWIASLESTNRKVHISRDAYGCLANGDTSVYSVNDICLLLNELTKQAKTEPYIWFHDIKPNETSHFKETNIQKNIIKLLLDGKAEASLNSLFIRLLSKSNLETHGKISVKDRAFDREFSFIEREEYLKLLLDTSDTEAFKILIKELSELGDFDSARLAIETTFNEPKLFSGDDIAQLLLNYAQAKFETDDNITIGIEYYLFPKMDLQQLRDTLNVLADIEPANKHHLTDIEEDINDFTLSLLQILLEKTDKISPQELHGWIKHNTAFGYHKHTWDSFSLEYFQTNKELKREIQSIELNKVQDSNEHWHVLAHELSNKAKGLFFDAEDIYFHMEILVQNNSINDETVEKWNNFLQILGRREGENEQVWALAEKQAKTNENLKHKLDKINNAKTPAILEESERLEVEYEQERIQESHKRHCIYSDYTEQLINGKNTHLLYQAAQAYLNNFLEYREYSSALKRIEKYVGSQNVNSVLKGFKHIASKSAIPSAKEIILNQTQNNKRYHAIDICLAYSLHQHLQEKSICSLRKEVLEAALIACSFGGLLNEEFERSNYLETLENTLIKNKDDFIEFVKEVFEQQLYSGSVHIEGLHRLTSEKKFDPILETILPDWIENGASVSTECLETIIYKVIALGETSSLLKFLKKHENEKNKDSELSNTWHAIAFSIGFDKFFDDIVKFANSSEENFFVLTRYLNDSSVPDDLTPEEINTEQLGFLIKTFARTFPNVEPPKSGWGTRHPFQKAQNIIHLIKTLGSITSHRAVSKLQELIKEDCLGDHLDITKNVLAELKRKIAESEIKKYKLQDTIKILSNNSPQSADDLQALLLDELHNIQDKIKNGIYNTHEIFWNNDTPQSENYCRDRLAELMEPSLEQSGIRIHPESTMTENTRCDIACDFRELCLPIEIKGQWHRKVWTAAKDQLEHHYTNYYRSKGRGIYLVFWFGDVTGKNPPSQNTISLPDSSNEMHDKLIENLSGELSDLTKIVVLDVSKPN